MRTELYWIEGPWPGRLAIMPRPRGGDWLQDEIQAWHRVGVNVVLSLLTADEMADLDLVNEGELCQANGISFHSFPIADRGVPSSREDASDLLTNLTDELADGKWVAMHCRQGIGRAAMIAICLLVLTGVAPEAGIQRVGAARGCPVPETAEQRRWIADFAQRVMAQPAT